jgi:hypothetical protein
MRSLALLGILVGAFAIPAPARADDNDVRLSGCLVRGHDGEGYLLTNVPGEAAWQRPADATVVPGPVGTSGTVASILYWLEKKDGLEEHVGHQVEIEGKLRGALIDGRIKIEPKAEWTDVEIEAGGESLKAQVPRSLMVVPSAPSSTSSSERTVDVLVRRVAPERVRMLAAVCGR